MPMLEVWKDIPGYDGKYRISNHGRFSSVDRWTKKHTLRRGSLREFGYRVVQLWRDGSYKHAMLHRLVADAFLGEPTGPIVRHLDGDGSHSFSWNLAWGSYSENMQDSLRHGTHIAWNRGIRPTHCFRGHEFIPENTYTNASGSRTCKTCKAIWQRESRAKARATA